MAPIDSTVSATRVETETADLTRGQMLIWAGQQLLPDVPLYNMAATWTIDGAVDEAIFARAFQLLIADCDALRTVIRTVDGLPRQEVVDLAYELPVVDLSGRPDPEAAAAAWADDRSRAHLDLERRSFDSALLKLSDRRYVWFFDQHHVLTDAWSFAVVFQTLSDQYTALRTGAEPPGPPTPFADYRAHEQAARAAGDEPDHWERHRTEPPSIPPLYGRAPATGSSRNERTSLDLGADRSARVRELLRQPPAQALTLDLAAFRVFATLVFAYLHRVSGHDRLTIGAPAHNRIDRRFARSVGLFTEVFPLEVGIAPGETFRSLLEKVRSEADSFLRSVGPGRSDADLHRGFNCVLNVLRATFGPFDGMAVTTRWIHPDHADPAHHLRLQVHDFGETGVYQIDVDANTDVFADGVAGQATSHLLRLLDAMLDDWDRPIASIDLLPDDHRRDTIAMARGTEKARPAEQTVLTMFEASVAATPDADAVRDGPRSLSYRELDATTNHLAAQLVERGAAAGSTVAMCIPRSMEAVVAMVATLRAGAAYVPLDPTWPTERLALVLADAGAELVLTGPTRPANLPEESPHLAVDVTARSGAGPHPVVVDPHALAYVMYTSGSTGRPKGVEVPHRALASYVAWARDFYGRGLRFPLFTPLTFDLTLTSVFVPICSNGSIVVYGETDETADMAVLDVFDDAEVDIVKLTPSHLTLLADRDLASPRVSQLILGGEDLPVHLARGVWQAFDGTVTIHNEYGPTEATVGCVIHTFDPSVDVTGSVPIGRPIENMAAYVVSESNDLLPPGIVGELVVAGAGVADGYRHLPELTAERFVSGAALDEARIYRTGDRARLRPDGVIEYLGRGDDQVKVRGARVELGEVEWALASHPGVTAAVAAVQRAPTAQPVADVVHCSRCGLASDYPGVSFDENRVCNQCRSFDGYHQRAEAYFEPMDRLRAIFEEGRATRRGDYDCIALLSGGKDSTYMLCQLVDMGLDVLAFTLDNGFISDETKANITRVVVELGVDHVFGSTPAMNEIFVDSLNRHSNVCNGCFKTIYTLSTQIAVERDIPFVVTGLSRGQFFETRLTEELFTELHVDVGQIDETVLHARRAYHRVDDAVRRLLDVSVFDADDVFDRVRFVDFYRYCDVELDTLLGYLGRRVPWVRPSDTGRSTNCLINDVGIYIHKRDRGYHNYALPYSWDVRLGHKTRDAALAELDDDIDVRRVRAILDEIGYVGDHAPDGAPARLVGYYTGPEEIPVAELRDHMVARLPAASVPTQYVRLDAVPLTSHGKVDRAALPRPGTARAETGGAYLAPQTETERVLCGIWAEVMGIERVGTGDDFFDLGGDSIMAIQIVARARRHGLGFTPTDLFDAPTVSALAGRAVAVGAVEDEPVSGPVGLSPAQCWLLDQDQPADARWNQVVRAELPPELDERAVAAALERFVTHHGALRQSFHRDPDGHWLSVVHDAAPAPTLRTEDLAGLADADRAARVAAVEDALHASFDVAQPPLLAAAYLRDAGTDRLLLVAHHLVVDAVSWSVLLGDLLSAELPHATTPVRRWNEQLAELGSAARDEERTYWAGVVAKEAPALPRDLDEAGAGAVESEETVVVGAGDDHPIEVVERAARSGRSTVHELLVTALALTLHGWTRSPDVRFFVEGHGRDTFEELDVSHTVGWFTSLYPLAVHLPTGDDPATALGEVKGQLRAVPGHSSHYGAFRYLDGEPQRREQLRLDQHAHLLFNYLGRVDPLGAGASGLRVAPLGLHRSPDVRRPFLLEVVARVVDGELRLEWTYSTRSHQPATVRSLAETMRDHLGAVVDACLQGRVTATGSDFPLAGLDDRGLDRLASLLDPGPP